MTDAAQTDAAPADRPTLVQPPEDGAEPPEDEATNADVITSPAKVLRIGSMTKQLLDEVRRAPLDEAGRTRLREIYETSVRELGECLSEDLRTELARLSSPFDSDAPTDPELRIAQAQLVGWLEGLFHGIQATLFTQQMAAQAQLEQMRHRGLPPGPMGNPGDQPRPGTYL